VGSIAPIIETQLVVVGECGGGGPTINGPTALVG